MYGKAAQKLIVCFTVFESGQITFGYGVTEWSVRRVLFGSPEFVSRGCVFVMSHKKTTILIKECWEQLLGKFIITYI
jgi:hypothetical protein